MTLPATACYQQHVLERVHIENFKSIANLDLPLGRFNVLIGENGSGKSNVLEALAFLAAAASGRLDNEFLASRGIRVSDARFMRSAFAAEERAIHLDASIAGIRQGFRIHSSADQGPYRHWVAEINVPQKQIEEDIRWAESEREIRGIDVVSHDEVETLVRAIRSEFPPQQVDPEQKDRLPSLSRRYLAARRIRHSEFSSALGPFVVFSPEASALRTFAVEGQILPLGVRGEGLFKLLAVLGNAAQNGPWLDLREHLHVLDWFDDIEAPRDPTSLEMSIRVRDRFIPKETGWFDQRSTNEAFLFLLFYLALFVSPQTPAVFAIDNLEASLNPKLCRELSTRLVGLAKKYGKQAIVTTHNPAILDGLDLTDDEQRLFVVSRGRNGDTKVRRISPPTPVNGEPPVRLSEAFLSGLLGGLPQNF